MFAPLQRVLRSDAEEVEWVAQPVHQHVAPQRASGARLAHHHLQHAVEYAQRERITIRELACQKWRQAANARVQQVHIAAIRDARGQRVFGRRGARREVPAKAETQHTMVLASRSGRHIA